ncbi:MAG TPA: ABC transporter ATP-binding protein [Stellaceae bacterium]|nr:ABC transporter ATP-binding protein [Stellaceae bacterium]
MIELQNVVKTLGGRRIVDGVSLTVETGAFCALVGSSGAGKSTTLKMVNRLVPMDSGAIRINGEDITRLEPETLRRRIGYAIQSVGLFPHWTVARNIATVPHLLGWTQARIDARVAELMELLRLDQAVHGGKYPHQLSGGQQQRVGVARALAADPELLLMDEPFGALDPITRDALAAELALIHRRTGKTIMFVTHDLDMALALADMIAIMHDGRLMQYAKPRDIIERPADDFVRDLVGRSGLGLKLLAVRKAAERARPGTAAGEPLDPAASLADALSEMVLRHSDAVPLGGGAGMVALADLVR